MRQQRKCNECGQNYFAKMINIFVLKQHTCPEDKTPLIISTFEGNTVYACSTCKKAFRKNVSTEYNAIGTKILGSTRNFLERDDRLAKDVTLEFDTVPVPEETLCQRCRNYQTRAAQATGKREKKLAIGLPDDLQMVPDTVSNADLYKYEIFRRTQEEYQTARKAEAYEKQKAEREAAEKARKAQLEAAAKAAQLPSKEEMKSLVDPEMLKIEQDAKAKDIRIEEYKKNQEQAKKIKETIAQTDAEIAKLKKELEESQKK
jgi:DNA-directed RNA polymerase subunit RPC12/RpoP